MLRVMNSLRKHLRREAARVGEDTATGRALLRLSRRVDEVVRETVNLELIARFERYLEQEGVKPGTEAYDSARRALKRALEDVGGRG
ncbi:hypothetical protein [Methanopyrus kandleri]|uniref:hypothetical protein n=1 Tax=Methanopyrus kandleri TaxID=2320 RepID=UPI0011E52029|nr:hypothetical protein [Methanopyrus kandleri]